MRARIGGTGPIVVIAARLAPDKRVLDACHAVLAVAADMPGIQLAIAGDGPLKEELQEWIGRNGDNRIHLLGLLPWDELSALYQVSDLMLFPATREKFGMVVIEALAAGVPVIAYNRSGAARDLIVDGQNGFLVREGDIEGMAECIGRTLSDPGLHRQMRARARDVVERHDVRIEAKRFSEALYRAAGTGVVVQRGNHDFQVASQGDK